MSRILSAVLFFALLGLIFQVLWNFVVPGVFHLPEISIVEALAMLALAGVIWRPKSEI